MSGKTVAIVIAAIVALIALVLILDRPEPEPEVEISAPEPQPTAPAPQPAPPPPPEPAPAPPPEPAPAPQPEVVAPASLEQGDELATEVVTELSPPAADWVPKEQPVRKWVSAVDQLAAGAIPDKNLPLKLALPKFEVEEVDGELRLAQANYARAEPLVDAITAIEPERLVRYYEAWQPILDGAFGELGQAGNFESRLQTAIARVLSVRPLDEAPKLEKAGPYYVFVDEDLEDASELEKLLWRIGPDNLLELQEYLRGVAAEM